MWRELSWKDKSRHATYLFWDKHRLEEGKSWMEIGKSNESLSAANTGFYSLLSSFWIDFLLIYIRLIILQTVQQDFGFPDISYTFFLKI